MISGTQTGWASIRRRPFWLLVHHFALRLFASENTSPGAGLDVSLGAILAFLALPGGFLSLVLLDKYSSFLRWYRGVRYFDPYAASIPDKYFFIVLSMVVTGMVTLVKWNRIFPDRRDYMMLAPLPVALPKIFAANLVAILILAFVFAVDVNAASSILFPVVVMKEDARLAPLISFAIMHATIVVLASLFTFFSLFSVLGLLMAAVPQRTFRRISLFVRVAAMTALLAVLCTSFAVPALLSNLSAHPLLRLLPPVWFVAEYQVWQNRGTRELIQLGAFGMRMVPLVMAAALAVYAIAYRRYFLRIPETNPLSGVASVKRSFRIPLLDRAMLRSPFERACYYFALRTIARSEEHCLLAGAFVAFGVVLAAQAASTAFDTGLFVHGVPKSSLLAIPFLLYFFVMVGMRAVFNIPVEYKANWMFQAIVEDDSYAAAKVARKVLLTPAVALVLASTGVTIWFLGWRMGITHLVFSLFWCALLAEVLVLSYRKIFFTCSLPPMNNRGPLLFAVTILGLVAFTAIGSDWEHVLLARPSRLIVLAMLGPALFWVLAHLRREVLDVERTVVFEESAPQTVRVLGLVNQP